MSHSMFDLFKVGVGPSSSHTVGPMVACARFTQYAAQTLSVTDIERVKVDLYGSLALTGKGHATDVACVMGLMGEMPATIESDEIDTMTKLVKNGGELPFAGRHYIPFNWQANIAFHYEQVLPEHPNGMTVSAYDKAGNCLASKTYFSVGGGFVVEEGETDALATDFVPPHPFNSAAELLDQCAKTGMTISELMFTNEVARARYHDSGATRDTVNQGLDHIWQVMRECIDRGIKQGGVLPGGLNIKRRAKGMYDAIHDKQAHGLPTDTNDWVNLFAMAVNEENAAGGRVVTAPTNGAAGVIPAVLAYYDKFVSPNNPDGIRTFMATSAAIGSLYKTNASISAAEVGCQGEIGVACSMAAGGLAAAMGASNQQIENAAEIGMEHNLGLTCDPIDGLVQVPCIERNTMGAVKAINATRLAMGGDGEHHVSLDSVIKTMHETGLDMMSKYKETSQGGLATNVIPINVVAC
ncbi:L-serine ammonia-lyase [Salinivibrio sp. IB868]|uniref:L-serine ammonia-lyase n=1 Tax=unclassified Salinivibrio TaxID=2636825 RepID=UPI000986F1B3|nr:MULTISPECIES: L-serine ammonia-lyase [unclassified Salinivibrio]OOE67589.1 L-serine ammonia-lyase [Salinivibrio sp. IB868]OOE71806.1 L-serine ammonia-lyase [Salinivibrio sp. IB870]